ncbi:MAG: Nif3-like dinuclear metal center hexameric protein [Nocardioidaceae bacterium]
MSSPASLADAVAVLEQLYPRRWAGEGDPVGLVVGDPSSEVGSVLFAIDPVQVVVDEAVERDVDLLVVHHPLLFRPVSSVAADTPKGRVIHQLITHKIGLYVAHTNADSPPHGVSESLAAALGLQDLRALRPDPADPLDKIVVFAPREDAEELVEVLSKAGAGAIGDYDWCAWVSEGLGRFRPGAGADPAIGQVGELEVVEETRIEMVLARDRRDEVVAALRAHHPYEEPAFDLLELATWVGERGAGRVGTLLEPKTLRDFADQVADSLPDTAVGARVSGDLDRQVQTVAVAGGAGDFLLDSARGDGIDVYVTSDLRHHPASEFREHRAAPALIDIPHWAAEWTWLPVVEQQLVAAMAEGGRYLATEVSRLCTDPWNYRSTGLPGPR